MKSLNVQTKIGRKEVDIYYLTQKNKKHVYVGSSVNTRTRLMQHKKGTDSRLIGNGYFTVKGIRLVVLKTVPRKERFIWEKHYMDLFKSHGYLLANKQNILNVKRKERSEFRKTWERI